MTRPGAPSCSASANGASSPWLWGKEWAGTCGTTDIKDRWSGEEWEPGHCCNYGVVDILDEQTDLYSFAGPGHWNDPDMLEVGNGGMTTNEYRSHFSFWALLAPLIAGNDLRDIGRDSRHPANKEVIAIDQDPLGRQGRRVWKDGDLEVWSKALAGGRRALILFNRGESEKEITAKWTVLDYPESLSASVRDLWQKKDLGKSIGKFLAPVAPHAVFMVTLAP